MPKLSIITINLNNASGLRKTIESVVSQTFQDFEYLVIDGGSTDGSVEVIKEFEDKITYWVSEPDKGIYNAMNKGILKARGEYLQFLNSGDWLVDESVILRIFNQKQEADILYGDYSLSYNENTRKHMSFKDIDINLQFLLKASLGHPASFIKRTLFESDLYDDSLKIVSDWKFFMEKIVMESCHINYLDLNIAVYDMGGISSDKAMMKLIDEERQCVMKSLFPPLVLEDIKELQKLKRNSTVARVLEIQKNRGLGYFLKGLIKILHKLSK